MTNDGMTNDESQNYPVENCRVRLPVALPSG